MMLPIFTMTVTANIVITTLGLFEHKVFYDARNSTLRLIETGNGRKDLAVFTMEGELQVPQGDEPIPSILFRKENDIKHYISLKKAKSENSYKLRITKKRELAATFLVKPIGTKGKYFSVKYKDEETDTILCLQGGFPTNNSHIIYDQVHSRVGNCYTRRHKDTHIIPLVASIPQKDAKCLSR